MTEAAERSPTVTLDDIVAARDGLDAVMRATPLKFSRALSERVGADVLLKCENLQRAGSFKFRGAYTRLSRRSDEEKSGNQGRLDQSDEVWFFNRRR